MYKNFCIIDLILKIGAASALHALKAKWTRFPESWEGLDPCGTNWVGITCSNHRVVSM